MKRIMILSVAAVLFSHAQAKPTAEEVKQVIDYFYTGQADGVILADVKLCDDVYTQGEHKNECMAERADAKLTKGEAATVWMMFMVPDKVEPQNIMLQYDHAGTTMAVERAKITSAVRFRTWTKITPDRPGEWKVKILHDQGDNIELIKELTVEVVDAPAQ